MLSCIRLKTTFVSVSKPKTGPEKTDHQRENCKVQIDRAPARWTANTVSPSLRKVLESTGSALTCQWYQAEHCCRARDCIHGRQMRRTGTKGRILASGVGVGRSCHASKSTQMSYFSFQFPFEVNTQQSRWRYEWLN